MTSLDQHDTFENVVICCGQQLLQSALSIMKGYLSLSAYLPNVFGISIMGESELFSYCLKKQICCSEISTTMRRLESHKAENDEDRK